MTRSAFSIFDVLLLIFLVVGLIAGAFIIFAPLAGSGSPSPRMANARQLGDIHRQMVLFAQDNKDFYPGIDPQTRLPLPAVTVGPDDAPLIFNGQPFDDDAGLHPASRLALLVDQKYFAPDLMISPLDLGSKTKWISDQTSISTRNYSYALLDIRHDGRRVEWRDTNHADAAVLSDRAIHNGAGTAHSIHTEPDSGWQGNVVFNDNRVDWVTTTSLPDAQYGKAAPVSTDDLFAPDFNSEGKPHHDALMAHDKAEGGPSPN
ncbi:MAG: hypothetical protein R3336_02965 [Phycisphaeraceae bacterium]|nr:hypothetical protein [Phycisphaeraceae bacterium]